MTNVGRTLDRWSRVYIDGYDMSGYTRGIGPLTWTFPEVPIKALSDEVVGALVGQPEISVGTLTGIFDNTATSGMHVLFNAPGSLRDVMVAMGIRAVPAEGDEVFMGSFEQATYDVAPSGDDIALTLNFDKTSPAEDMDYDKPWGDLLHENSAETAANTAVAVVDGGAQTTAGGFMMYQIFSVIGSGTVTIKVQHADTNLDGGFADLGGCTSGAIAHGSVPAANIVKTTAITTTVERYLRWQIALTGITSVTFALGFVRGR